MYFLNWVLACFLSQNCLLQLPTAYLQSEQRIEYTKPSLKLSVVSMSLAARKDNIVLTHQVRGMEDSIATASVKLSSIGRDVAQSLDQQMGLMTELEVMQAEGGALRELAEGSAALAQAVWRGYAVRKDLHRR